MSAGSISRRGVLRGGAGVAGALALPAIVRAQSMKVAEAGQPAGRLGLSEARTAGLVVAKEKGFFADAGLDVTINQGKGSGSTAQIVGLESGSIRVRRRICGRQQRVQGHEAEDGGGVYRRNPGRGAGARRVRHQDAEGSRRQDHRHRDRIRAVPAMAGIHEGCWPGRQQGPRHQCRRRGRRAGVDFRTGGRHRRVRARVTSHRSKFAERRRCAPSGMPTRA